MTEATRSANLNSNITGWVRLLMHQRGGMTQTELAEHIGLERSLVTRTFAGRRSWKIEEIESLARLFSVSPALFFDDPEAAFRSRCDWSATQLALTGRELATVAA
jgi:transcriptional regulator with XRE-family HTH domain